MSESSLRGTFEERKAQAIAAGRIKGPKMSKAELKRRAMREILGKLPEPYSRMLDNGVFKYRI